MVIRILVNVVYLEWNCHTEGASKIRDIQTVC